MRAKSSWNYSLFPFSLCIQQVSHCMCVTTISTTSTPSSWCSTAKNHIKGSTAQSGFKKNEKQIFFFGENTDFHHHLSLWQSWCRWNAALSQRSSGYVLRYFEASFWCEKHYIYGFESVEKHWATLSTLFRSIINYYLLKFDLIRNVYSTIFCSFVSARFMPRCTNSDWVFPARLIRLPHAHWHLKPWKGN